MLRRFRLPLTEHGPETFHQQISKQCIYLNTSFLSVMEETGSTFFSNHTNIQMQLCIHWTTWLSVIMHTRNGGVQIYSCKTADCLNCMPCCLAEETKLWKISHKFSEALKLRPSMLSDPVHTFHLLFRDILGKSNGSFMQSKWMKSTLILIRLGPGGRRVKG